MNDDQKQLSHAAEGAAFIAHADLKLAEAAAPLSQVPPVKALGKATELADQPPLVAASLAVIASGLVTHNRQLARAGLRMLLAHALATGVKAIIKNNVDRTRPSKVCDDGEYLAVRGHETDGDYRSLPSGHTAGAVAVARAIAREYPGAAPAANSTAFLVALLQIPRKAHFATDVVVGGTIGLASEALVDRLLERILR